MTDNAPAARGRVGVGATPARVGAKGVSNRVPGRRSRDAGAAAGPLSEFERPGGNRVGERADTGPV